MRNDNAECRNRITCRAYAKINLLLDVTGRLPNGYHSVVMLNQSISLHDVVTVELTQNRGIEIVCDCKGIPLDSRNIAWKACEAFGIGGGVKITLEKHIPGEAGLAGGSADAAAVLTALNELFPGTTSESLYSIAARLGADVPFCLKGGCCLAQGVGEILTPLPCLPDDYSVALVKPEAISVSTARAYAAMDAIALRRPRTDEAVALAQQGRWAEAFPLCANVFEQVTQLPGLAECKDEALAAGALLCQMTVSGSAVFAIMRNDALPALGALGTVHVYKPVPFGVELI